MKNINELIKITGLTEEIIQEYEDLQLIKSYQGCNECKLYEDEEVLKLWRISLLISAGYEPYEIVPAIDLDYNALHSMLAEKRIKVDREMARLSGIRSITTKAMQLRMMDKRFIKAISEDFPYTKVIKYLENLD